MKKLLFIIAVITLLTSCFNKSDYAYNEKMASLFLDSKEKLDESYEKLQSGYYDISNENEISYDMGLKRAQGMTTYINELKDLVNELQPSKIAEPFHKEVNDYMTQMANEYAPLLVKYVTEQDSLARVSIQEDIKLKKEALDTKADKCLEIQQAFLNEAGLQPKE